MNTERMAVSVRGRSVVVPAASIGGVTVMVSGRFPRIASVAEEYWTENAAPKEPGAFVAQIAKGPLRADLVTFAQEIDHHDPEHSFRFEWDNVAAIDTSVFDRWWASLPQATRKNCRRAERRGARTEVVPLDEELARGIKRIYDESPIRQGRRFWHYGKDLETVWRENATYPERSVFLATRVDGELIGFAKIVFVGRFAKIMQILSAAAHADKRPMNALVAKAVEICNQRGASYLIYGKFQYGNGTADSLMEFKTRNGFVRLDYPRYFVPVTLRGKLALACRLHRPLIEILPAPVLDTLVQVRDSAVRLMWRERNTQERHAGADAA